METNVRSLIVDLNNFAKFPSIAVGYLAAILRDAGQEVDVFTPLAFGVAGVSREPQFGLLSHRVRYRTAVSKSKVVRLLRHRLATYRRSQLLRASRSIANRFASKIKEEAPDLVLISTYLIYYDLCVMIGRICMSQGIPVLIGGPYFAEPDVANRWVGIEGVCGLVCGEVDLELPQITQAVVEGHPSLSKFRSIRTTANRDDYFTPPLQNLDALPFADYSDFSWDHYPSRIIPILTGRGCGWGVCTFCSDITSTAHRTYRSRSPDCVLDEIAFQADRHCCRRFVFTDLMLNSNISVWRGLLGRMQSTVPNSEWIASVHVTDRDDNGLSREELVSARNAGMVRLTTGFESGSQRILDLMRKGTSVKRTSQFVADADSAGISVRLTLIVGYPGERAEDVEATARFLERHFTFIERVQLNRFQIMIGSAFERQLKKNPSAYPGLTSLTVDRREAITHHRYREVDQSSYRRAVNRLLRAVHRINRKPLRQSALEFDGVM